MGGWGEKGGRKKKEEEGKEGEKQEWKRGRGPGRTMGVYVFQALGGPFHVILYILTHNLNLLP